MTSFSRILFVAVTVVSFAVQPALVSAQGAAGAGGILRYDRIHHPVLSEKGMVATQEAVASQVGADILARGGNAVDAAVAVGFALTVTLPRAGNIGGGGFMLAYLADLDKTIAIDFREMAPSSAYETMFQDSDGNVDNDLARFSHKSSGVPGSVAGLAHALEKYGTMSLAEVIEPSVRLAADGIEMTWDLAVSLERSKNRLSAQDASRAVFYKPDGSNYVAGENWVQADLARTLAAIRDGGVDAFYKGEIARQIVAEMEQGGGMITMEDMANYRVVERDAVEGSYRGHRVVSMPPPSSGGVHIIQILNMLEHFDVPAMGAGSARAIHTLTEAMRLAYADRSEHLGDPDYWDVPVGWLTSKSYGDQLAPRIQPEKATPSEMVSPGKAPPKESSDTTHYGVVDSAGNAVAVTYTLNFSYGSGKVVSGAGFLLNNEMDDFSSKPGSPNGYGLIGGVANAIEPGKRPLSSMTPTIVFKDGKPWIVTGSPGGSRIITTVLQVIVNAIDFGMGAAEAVSAPRTHHQWYPDMLFHEPGFSPDTLAILESWGHSLQPTETMGSAQTIMLENGMFYGAADPRRPGAAAIAPE